MTPSKTVQMFTDQHLAHGATLTPTEIAQWLEDYRQVMLGSERVASKLISLKVPEPLLRMFRAKAKAQGLRYQTQIKELMVAWLRM